MSYRLALQIIAAVITAGILVGFHYGVGAFLDAMSPDFASGVLVGGLFVGGIFALAHWIESWSSSDTPRR